MKHFGKGALTALLVTILVWTVAGCSESPPQDGERTLVSITITSPPTKTAYAIGEALDLTGLVVTGTYSDNSTQTETVSASNVSGYNADTIGQQTLTVTVNGKTATFAVTVNAGILQSIAITSPPTKTTYTVGESLDLTGLVVTGTYSDNSTQTETVSASNVSGYNADTIGQQTLTVTVNGKTATFVVTMNSAALQSIAITIPPTKTTYTVGESLDLTGLVVTGTYSDGNTKSETVGASNVSGYNADTIGQQTLTVTVNGKTATFVVTVNPVVLVSIKITTPLTKTTYNKGEELDLDGLVVTGTYSDGNAVPENVNLSDVSGYDTNTIREQTLTVTVNGMTATFVVTVNPAALVAIEITSPPTKTVYDKGEVLDLDGLVVTGTYSDDTTQTETASLADVSGYDPDASGEQILTITIGDKTAAFVVRVKTTAALTVSLDAISGFPENIVLSRTGNNGAPTSITLEIAGTYVGYEWYLNDEFVSMSASYTLNAANCRLGPNYLVVEVRTAAYVYYSKEITFIVE